VNEAEEDRPAPDSSPGFTGERVEPVADHLADSGAGQVWLAGPNGPQPGYRPGVASGEPPPHDESQAWPTQTWPSTQGWPQPQGVPPTQGWPVQQGGVPPGWQQPRSPASAIPAQVRSIGIAVQIMLVISFLAGVASLAAEISQLKLLERIEDRPSSFSYAEADASDQLVLQVSLVYLTCFVATGVLFIIWFYRVRKNAGRWAPTAQTRSQGWAIWGWICPVVLFWFPYQIARDGLAAARPLDARPGEGLGIVKTWWALWAGQLALAAVERLQSRQLDTIEQIMTSARTGLGATILLLAAGIVAIFVVRKITELQDRRLRWEAAGGGSRGGVSAGVAPL